MLLVQQAAFLVICNDFNENSEMMKFCEAKDSLLFCSAEQNFQ